MSFYSLSLHYLRLAAILLAVVGGLAAGPCGDPGDDAELTPTESSAPTATPGLHAWDTLQLQDGVRLVRSCDELPDGSWTHQGAVTQSLEGAETRWAMFYYHQPSDARYVLVLYSGEDTLGCDAHVNGAINNRRRTGLDGVDATLDAVLARDRAQVESSIEYTSIGCASPRYANGPPPCWPDESPGALGGALPLTDCSGDWQRREDVEQHGGFFGSLFRSAPVEFSIWAVYRSEDRDRIVALFRFGLLDGVPFEHGFALTMTREGRIIGAGKLCDEVESYVPAWGSVEFFITPPETDDFDAAAKIAAVETWISAQGNTPAGMCGAVSTVIVTEGDAWCYDYYRAGATITAAGPVHSDDRVSLFLDQREDGTFVVSIAERRLLSPVPATPIPGPISDWRLSHPQQGVYAWSAVTGAAYYRVHGTPILHRENGANACLPPLVEDTRTLEVDQIVDAADRRYAASLPPLPEGDTWYVRSEEMLSIEAIAADGTTIIAATGLSGIRDLYCDDSGTVPAN